jgi:hypothetical protein
MAVVMRLFGGLFLGIAGFRWHRLQPCRAGQLLRVLESSAGILPVRMR